MQNFFLDAVDFLTGLLSGLLSLLSPCFIALVLAYLLNPAVTWFAEKCKSRVLAIAVTYLLATAAVCGLVCGFVVLIIGTLPKGSPIDIVQQILSYFESAYRAADAFFTDVLPAGTPSPIRASLEALLDRLESRFSVDAAFTFLSGLSGILISFVIGLVASIYLLKDKDYFISLWERFLALVLPQKTHGLLCETLDEIHQVLSTFIKGALIDSFIIAFLSSVVLTVLRVNYAVIIGILGGFLNIIPYFGPFFGMIPAFAVAAVTGGLAHGALAILGLFAVQQLDSNYIYPKIVGTSTGLHPLFILLAVSVFGSLGGILGMLLAVPLAGVAQIFIKKWAFRK